MSDIKALLVDFRSAFNMVIPALLQDKVSYLNMPDSTSRWIMTDGSL